MISPINGSISQRLNLSGGCQLRVSSERRRVDHAAAEFACSVNPTLIMPGIPASPTRTALARMRNVVLSVTRIHSTKGKIVMRTAGNPETDKAIFIIQAFGTCFDLFVLDRALK